MSAFIDLENAVKAWRQRVFCDDRRPGGGNGTKRGDGSGTGG